MPQTNTQRNRRSPFGGPAAPMAVPANKLDFADTEDQVYGLVSVLYHSLQGAQACEQYTDDAERAGDDELVRFFEECREGQNERALRAKQLLVARVGEATDSDGGDESENADADDEA